MDDIKRSVKYGSGLYGFDADDDIVLMSGNAEIYDILDMPVGIALKVVKSFVSGRFDLDIRGNYFMAGRGDFHGPNCRYYSKSDYDLLIKNELLDIIVKIELLIKLKFPLINYQPSGNYLFHKDYIFDIDNNRLVDSRYDQLSAKHINEILDIDDYPVEELFVEISREQIQQLLAVGDPYTYYERKPKLGVDDIGEDLEPVTHFLHKFHGLPGTTQIRILEYTGFKAPPEFYNQNDFNEMVDCLFELIDGSIINTAIANKEWLKKFIERRPTKDFHRLISLSSDCSK